MANYRAVLIPPGPLKSDLYRWEFLTPGNLPMAYSTPNGARRGLTALLTAIEQGRYVIIDETGKKK